MQNTTMWLAQQRAVEARQRAAEDRLARLARRSGVHRSLLQRVRGRG